MAPPIINFVDVNVIVGGAVADKFSFGALMGVFEHNITTDRQAGPFFSIAEVNAAGFTSTATPGINAWATAVFAQDDGVDQLLIGRRIPLAGGIAKQVWQVDATPGPEVFVDQTTEFNDATDNDFTPFPATEAVGDYVAIGFNEPFGQVIFDAANGTVGVVGAVTWEYLSAPGVWTALAGVTDNTMAFTAGATDGQDLTFTIPTGWTAQVLNGVSAFYIRARITTVYTTNPVYDQGFVGTDADLTASLDAIELAGADTWYITNIGTRTDADIALLGAWTEARSKIAIAQSSDLALVAALALQAASYQRTALIFHDDDTEYLDGAWSSSGGGMNLDVPDGVGIWIYRSLEGVPFDPVTGAQATAIYAANANLFGRNLGLSFTSKGTMASGRFIDVTTTGDWTKARLEEAILSAFVGANKIPYTNAGINQIRAVISGVLTQGQSFGHFSTDVTPEILAPDISEVSAADKANRELTVTVNVTLAGAIQKATINVNLTL